MADEDELMIPVRVTQRQIELAVSKAVQAKADEITAEFKRSLEANSDRLHDANRALEDRVDASRERVDTKIRHVDESLGGLQKKVETRVNKYVIPAVVITFFMIAIAIFTAVGGFDVIGKLQELKNGVRDGNRSLEDSNKKLKDLEQELKDLKTKADAATSQADAERYNALEKKYDDLIAQLVAAKSLKPVPVPKPGDKTK